MEDRRTLRTKRAIREAFIKLASKKDLNKITVSELSELADIGRGTFYLHYKDVFDLMEALENEALTNLASMSEDMYNNKGVTDLQPLLDTVVCYIWKNKDIFGLLLSTKGNAQFLERFKCFFKSKIIDDSNNTEYSYSIIYAISGCLGIFQEWAVGGFTTPPNKIALIIRNAIRND